MDNVGYLRSFSFQNSLSDLPSLFYLIRVSSGGSKCGWVIPVIHPFLLDTFFIVALFSRRFLCKVSYSICFSSYDWVNNIIS